MVAGPIPKSFYSNHLIVFDKNFVYKVGTDGNEYNYHAVSKACKEVEEKKKINGGMG